MLTGDQGGAGERAQRDHKDVLSQCGLHPRNGRGEPEADFTGPREVEYDTNLKLLSKTLEDSDIFKPDTRDNEWSDWKFSCRELCQVRALVLVWPIE